MASRSRESGISTISQSARSTCPFAFIWSRNLKPDGQLLEELVSLRQAEERFLWRYTFGGQFGHHAPSPDIGPPPSRCAAPSGM